MSTPQQKRHRTGVTVLNHTQLIDKWAARAKQRFPPFDWERRKYMKGRGSTADIQQLEEAASHLGDLASLCTSGFAQQKALDNILTSLHADYQILSRPDDKLVHGVPVDAKGDEVNYATRSSDAAELWRIMLGHVLNLKRSTRKGGSEGLRRAMDCLADTKAGNQRRRPACAMDSMSSPTPGIHGTDTPESPSGQSIPRDADGLADFARLTSGFDVEGFPDHDIDNEFLSSAFAGDDDDIETAHGPQQAVLAQQAIVAPDMQADVDECELLEYTEICRCKRCVTCCVLTIDDEETFKPYRRKKLKMNKKLKL